MAAKNNASGKSQAHSSGSYTPSRAEMEASARAAEEKMRHMTKAQKEALANAWNGMDIQKRKKKTSGGEK